MHYIKSRTILNTTGSLPLKKIRSKLDNSFSENNASQYSWAREAMRVALDEAAAATTHGDVPIGAVIVRNGNIIARQHNRRELDQDPTAHAEILVLREAASLLGTWRLADCSVVVTLEPCIMCAGALALSRISSLIFGAYDQKMGACGTLYNISCDPRINHQFNVTSGIMEEECAVILKDFFENLRLPDKTQ